MSTRHKVSCINKTNRLDAHERIKAIGGQNPDGTPWKLSQEDAIAAIEAGKWSFYVEGKGLLGAGLPVDVIVASRLGRKYLKTVADGEQPNNLLSLYECVG